MHGHRTGAAVLLAAALGIAALAPSPAQANKKDAAAVGALIGLAVGAAAVADYRNHEYRRGRWDDAFSPHHDVLCYPRIGECYRYGQYSAKWTAKIYGY